MTLIDFRAPLTLSNFIIKKRKEKKKKKKQRLIRRHKLLLLTLFVDPTNTWRSVIDYLKKKKNQTKINF